jgi:Ricin-type beta-trefoil lectin domain-like
VNELLGFPANLTVAATERVARFGGFKVPTVRNVELTAPYFHNGDSLTLLQIVEFYNRGGNFANENRPDLDADIQPLGLTSDERVALVEFMRALTDDRVRYHRAPFDHPELPVTDGHVGDTAAVSAGSSATAADAVRVLPAVGASGYPAGQVPANFLATGYSDQAVYELRSNTGKCVAPFWGALTLTLTSLKTESCAGRNYQRYRVVVGDEGSVMLVNQLNGMRVDAWFAAGISGGLVYVNSPRSSTDQHWRLEDVGSGDVRIRNRGGQCLSTSILNDVRIQNCSTANASQRYKLVRVAS